MADYKDFYVKKDNSGGIKYSASRIEQLIQLLRLVWDGDIISKYHRDELVKAGLAQIIEGGYNLITAKGVRYLSDLGIIHP